MKKEEYVDALFNQSYLAEFEREELARLVDACKSRLFLPGEALWAVGEKRTGAFIIVSGRVERKVRITGSRRNEQYGEVGRILALSALVSDWQFHSSAYAHDKTEVLMLSRRSFQKLFDAEDIVAYKLVDQIAAYLVRDMRRANERVQEVFGRPAETLRMLRRRIREDTKA